MDGSAPDILRANMLSKWRAHLAPLLALHEGPGKLWEKDETGRDWSNVTDHCLLEAARVDVFARLLRLSAGVREDLVAAAGAHDFYKKFEIAATRADLASGGTGRAGYLRAERESEAHLRAAGLSDRVIRLIHSVGGEPENVLETERIADLAAPSEEEIAYLIMRYVDDYTRGSAWVAPADENLQNEIDRRADQNRANPDYRRMDEEGRSFYEGTSFAGMSRFEAQAAAAHLAEAKLAELLRIRAGLEMEARRVPEAIDTILRTVATPGR
jgi:hypothetical protein